MNTYVVRVKDKQTGEYTGEKRIVNETEIRKSKDGKKFYITLVRVDKNETITITGSYGAGGVPNPRVFINIDKLG